MSESMLIRRAAALQVLNKYARATKKYYLYGTAGFRFEVDEHSPQIFARTGMLAHFRSCVLGGKNIGLCITASHNLAKDNGIKLIDPDGGMLAQDWEDVATRVINAETNEKCIDLLLDLCPTAGTSSSSVLLARDTRESSEMLERCASEAIAAWNGSAPLSLGLATTPQLHYCVMERNREGFHKTTCEELATLDTYNTLVCESYTKLVEGTKPLEGKFAVDCSNGIGGLRFAPINQKLGFCDILFNVDDVTQLNLNCGAEYVQKEQKPPANLPAAGSGVSRFASFDGDADRVVCFYLDNGKFHLLDGDKIASLFTLFIKRQLDDIKLDCEVKIGTVQTAYANGSSTHFVSEVLKVDVPKVKTGVKHLHHKAQEYDVGIYFEANGHGTVLFKPEFVEKIQLRAKQGNSPAASRLFNFILLLNQATGDAIADVLAVDAALRVLEYKSFEQWNSLYTDLPSKQCKVKCQDRSAITVNEDETRCIRPAALQQALDTAMQNSVSMARVFVRPSGTENVIRVYAEASTSKDAQRLAQIAEQAICEYAGGVPAEGSEAKRVKM